MPERNLVLIGMPGCGKTRIGQLLAKTLTWDFLDTDQQIEEKAQCGIPEIFSAHGEAFFRQLESEVAAACSALHGKVIATGGGIVLLPENIRMLKQNGRLYYLRRNLDMLDRRDRPLSSSPEALEKLFLQRAPLYLQAADCVIDNQALPETAVRAILEDFYENSGH